MESKNIFNPFSNLFDSPKAKCESDKVSLDDPEFANLDPHLKYDDVEKQAEEEGLPPNMRKSPRKPPSYEQFINPVRSITKKYEHINGFKFDVGGAPTPKLHLLNTWSISEKKDSHGGPGMAMGPMGPEMGGGSKQLGTYTLACQYIGGPIEDMMPTPTNPYGKMPPFILTGRMDSNGSLEGHFIKHFDSKTQLRVSTAFPMGSEIAYSMVAADLEYDGEDYTHTFKYGTATWGFNFMQTIGRKLVLGFDFMHLAEHKRSLLSGAMRYNHLKHSFYGHYDAAHGMITLAYLQKVNKNAQVVSELKMDFSGKTKTILGYRQRFQSTEVIATINSKGKISSVMNLMSGLFNLKLCAQADYGKDNYKFGYGISLGQTG